MQHPGLQHMRDRNTPSASPPMMNGPHHPGMSTPPQPQNLSRPSSRTHVRRPSSNLVPQNHPHPQAAQNMPPNVGYSYQPNAQYYHPQQQQQQQQQQQPPAGPGMHGQQQFAPPHPPHHQPHHYTHPPPNQHMSNQHMHQLYMQDQRRSSMPPQMPMQQGHPDQNRMQSIQTPPQASRPFQSPPLPQPASLPRPQQQQQQHPQGMPQHENGQAAMRREWAAAAPGAEASRANNSHVRQDAVPGRPSSIDVGAAMRNGEQAGSQSRFGPPPPSAPPRPQMRTSSTSSIPIQPPSRVNSLPTDAKKPQLTLQIPGEPSDAGSGTGDSSPKETNKTSGTTPAKAGATESSHSSGIVLPAPSPRSASAGAILSAGATGPANPFARPNPPTASFGNGPKQATGDSYKDSIASPMSALPSRVMGESGFMNSPSSMFPELGFGSMHGNNLASPAIYQPTPVAYHGPSFRDDPPDKRKTADDLGGDNGPPKKVKT